jgi:hypothetical protein
MENTSQSANEHEAKQPSEPRAEPRAEPQDEVSESSPPSPYIEGWRMYAITTGLMLSCICSGLVRVYGQTWQQGVS